LACRFATASAFARASRCTRSTGCSPGSGVSSTMGAATVKGIPKRSRRARLYGEVDPSTRCRSWELLMRAPSADPLEKQAFIRLFVFDTRGGRRYYTRPMPRPSDVRNDSLVNAAGPAATGSRLERTYSSSDLPRLAGAGVLGASTLQASFRFSRYEGHPAVDGTLVGR